MALCPARQRGVRVGRRRARRGDRHRAVVLLGVRSGDGGGRGRDRLADKVARLRVFDERGGAHGPLAARPRRARRLCISQFTLYGDTRRGLCARASRRRPSRPTAERLYEPFCDELRRQRGAGRDRAVRRPDVGRADQRGPGDAAAGGLSRAVSGREAAETAVGRPLYFGRSLTFQETCGCQPHFEVGLRPLFFRHDA